MKKKPTPAERAQSLLQFAHERRREERRAACPICRLPDEVRAQLRVARDKKIDTRTRLDWLASIGHGDITELDLKTHGSSGHDSLDQQKAVAS